MRAYAQTPTGLILPEHLAKARYERPTCVEFFAGCGGMALGLKMAGWHVVAAIEWDCTAAMTYATNLCRYGELQMHFVEDADRDRMEQEIERSWKKGGSVLQAKFSTAGSGWISHHPDVPGTQHLIIGDVRKLTGRKILDIIGMERGELGCVSGGPPCQGFSKAGKQNVADPRNNLTFEFARLVLELNPKTMIMENVPAILEMVTPDGLPVVDTLVRALEDGSFATLDALRRTLAAQAGSAAGILRGKKREKNKDSAKAEADRPADEQLAMFA